MPLQDTEGRACGKCGGSGTLTYRTLGDALPTPMGNGTTVQAMGGFGTRPCECVRDLPAIDGEATWWGSETIFSEVVQVPIFNEAAEVNAECEIPYRGDGRRVHRTAANAYYPPLINVDTPRSMTFHAEDARKFADALRAAADACDKADALATATEDSP